VILYIHGFRSSSQSVKAQETRRWLTAQGRAQEWVCPDLPPYPLAAMQILDNLVQAAQEPPKLIGSSLGGFYATVLVARYGLKAVVVNPAVHPALILRPALGLITSFYGNEQYLFTEQHLQELQSLDLPAPLHPNNILFMQERGDEVLDWQTGLAYYRDCHQLVFAGGDHGFTRYRAVLDLIDHFLND
jgi:predicted esterase YcpF (UPF0227 family)